jgi:large subunit ribosomal protein L22
MAVATKEYRAEARFQRVSPQKARLVLDLIRGRGVEEALNTAAFTKKRIAPVIHKLLTSAVDNAKYVAGEQGLDLDVDNLYVKQALANDGPRMKRIRPAPMGRAYRYQRRLTHIVVSVAERHTNGASLVTRVEETTAAPVEPAETKAVKKAASGKTPAKKAEVKKAAAKSAEAQKPAAKKTAAKKRSTSKKAEK